MPPNSLYATQWRASRNHYFLFSRSGTRKSNGARVSLATKGVRRTIPLCGIVLILGSLGCGRASFYTAEPKSESTSAKQELIAVIETFLKDVPKNERSTFDRFFADDIIYTRGTGQVVIKNEILADTGKATVARANATF